MISDYFLAKPLQQCSKTEIRTLFREKLSNFAKTAEKIQSDKNIVDKVLNLDRIQRASTIAIYVSTDYEPDTRLLIKQWLKMGKTVVVPKILTKPQLQFYCINSFSDLKLGRFGILEPNEQLEKYDLHDLELTVILGLAFDRKGGRIGSGGGYTDWFLSESNAYSIAMAYSWQVFPKIPQESHDQKLQCIITEDEIIYS